MSYIDRSHSRLHNSTIWDPCICVSSLISNVGNPCSGIMYRYILLNAGYESQDISLGDVFYWNNSMVRINLEKLSMQGILYQVWGFDS